MNHESRSSRVLWSNWATTIVVVLALIFGVTSGAYAQPSGDAEIPSCQVEQAELADVHARIDAHNGRPHTFTLPQQQAQLNAYDAEAAALDGEQTADANRLVNCRVAHTALAAGQPVRNPTQKQIDAVKQAKNLVPNGYVPPSPPPLQPGKAATAVTTELRPLFDVLRGYTPPKRVDGWVVQGQSKPTIGDPDPSLHPTGGGTIIARPGYPNSAWVDLDHLVPLARIMYIPGFLQLTPENMLRVINAPVNLQWLSGPANLSKQSKSAGALLNVDPTWQQAQVTLENQVLLELESIIGQLVTNQGGN